MRDEHKTNKHENEQRLRKVLEDLESVAVQAYKPDGTITFWNRASELFYGFSTSEALGRNLLDLLLGPETRDEERRIMDRAVRTGILPSPGEIEVSRKDGTKRTILTSRILRQHPDGELEFYCFDVDITERKRAEEALRASEQRFRNLYENAPLGFYRTTPDGRILLANPALASMLGFSSVEDLAARNLQRDGFEPRYPRRVFIDIMERDGSVRGLESAWVRRDGSRILVRENATAIRGEDGSVLYYDGMVEDITERRRAEEELRREKDRAQSYLDIAGVVIVAIEPDQSIALVNKRACEVLGYDERDLVGRNWFDTIVPEDMRHEVRTVFGDLMAGRIAPWGYVENQVLTKQGDKRLIAWHNTVLRDEEGRIVATLSSGADITEIRLIEQELQNLQQALAHVSRVSTLGELATALAHEMNQPLAAIRTNAEAALQLMAAGNPDLKELREILVDIAADDERAGEIIRRMREPLKRGEPALTPLDMNALVKEIHQLVKNDAVLAGATIRLNLASALSPVLGDRIQLQQVLMNLVVNALDAVKDTTGGRRRIDVLTLAENGNMVRVEVRDSGRGIPGSNLEKIFEFLYTTKQKGLGVGLAICRTIVDACGGRIWAENPPDGGTRLVFTLPAYKGPTSSEDEP